MNIGIDLDGVLFDTESYFRTFATYCNTEFFKSEEVNKEELYFQKRYNWTEEQQAIFYDKCYQYIEKEAPIMPYAKMILEKLKEQGHKLFVITSRGNYFDDEIEITEKRFKDENLVFDGYYFSSKNKAETCKEANIDVMIDDLYENIEKVSSAGIKCLYFRDLVLKQFDENNKLIHEVRNWGDIYKEITCFDEWKL